MRDRASGQQRCHRNAVELSGRLSVTPPALDLHTGQRRMRRVDTAIDQSHPKLRRCIGLSWNRGLLCSRRRAGQGIAIEIVLDIFALRVELAQPLHRLLRCQTRRRALHHHAQPKRIEAALFCDDETRGLRCLQGRWTRRQRHDLTTHHDRAIGIAIQIARLRTHKRIQAQPAQLPQIALRLLHQAIRRSRQRWYGLRHVIRPRQRATQVAPTPAGRRPVLQASTSALPGFLPSPTPPWLLLHAMPH
ncbi:hypothetical protein [Xanthomonas vasicola]|uniref:hypothetical protein n=1 Tax=Xanthomonas vasicola TaxID=56459 RepID=UPI0026EC9611|nr:hypothetical protein [Xanthomonas vasicola]MDO6970340.1 hypothetical protein [Xanthomonas vasicola]